MKNKPLQSTPLQVEVSAIDLRQGPFCMSFNFDLEPLKGSIHRFGVLNPPYLLRNPEGAFTVVAGYQRLLSVREMGWSTIVCQVLPDDFPPFEALLLNLHDNLVHRHLNSVEKGMVLRRLTRFLDREEIVTSFMPLLGISSNKHTLELLLRLEELEEPIRISVAMERLSLRVAGLMASLDGADRLRMTDLFTSLKWSFNRQWEVSQWITEIASREGRSIREIIDGEEIARVLDNERINNPQKVKSIVEILKATRFPSLLEAEKSFREAFSTISLPSRVEVIPPPFFEGIDYRLEIVFTNGRELKEKLAVLSHLSALEGVTEFWKGI